MLQASLTNFSTCESPPTPPVFGLCIGAVILRMMLAHQPACADMLIACTQMLIQHSTPRIRALHAHSLPCRATQHSTAASSCRRCCHRRPIALCSAARWLLLTLHIDMKMIKATLHSDAQDTPLKRMAPALSYPAAFMPMTLLFCRLFDDITTGQAL